jgi:hypothetical protein
VLRTQRSRIAAVLAVATLSAGLLSACSSDSGTAADGGLTLAAIKSPIQLLRNEAAGRIPADVVDSIVQPTDKSSACKPSSEDPDENWRTWTSEVLTIITYDESRPVSDIEDTLIASFVDQGWTEGDAPADKTTRLVKDTTFATIDISSVAQDTTFDVQGQLQLIVGGPCVLTDGPNSPEVTKLEGNG